MGWISSARFLRGEIMSDFDLGKVIKQKLEVLLYAIDSRQGGFSELSYTGMQDIFLEPAMREIGLDRSQTEAVFMSRRLQQAMPLSAGMSPAEENSLNNIVTDVGMWKERTGYLFRRDENSLERKIPNGAEVKIAGSVVKDCFVSSGLKDVSYTKGDGYLTWRGIEFLEQISIRVAFDVRTKYKWRMRFNVGIFSKDGDLLCGVSDWEAFGKIIYAVVGLNFKEPFEYCDTSDSNLKILNNYLSIVVSTLNQVRSWRL